MCDNLSMMEEAYMDALCEDAGETDSERECFMGYWKITRERVEVLKLILKEMQEVPTSVHDIEVVMHCEKVLVEMLKALQV